MKHPPPMKIYILTDLEGVAGVVTPSQTSKGTKDYEEARRLLTAELTSAVDGILSASGGAEVYVNDGHNGGFNLVLENLHEEAKIVHGAPRPHGPRGPRRVLRRCLLNRVPRDGRG
ncbi:hypothetical protein CW680_01735 [Candidatus Bathyarchaeota archaeon]|nr:MAG: hypothetical protein CW680_01735 [Candidatus Bathyarchaeota archaeon]